MIRGLPGSTNTPLSWEFFAKMKDDMNLERIDLSSASRRNYLKNAATATLSVAGSWIFGKPFLSKAAIAATGRREKSPFSVRGTLGCGWNIFIRKGYSNHPRDNVSKAVLSVSASDFGRVRRSFRITYEFTERASLLPSIET